MRVSGSNMLQRPLKQKNLTTSWKSLLTALVCWSYRTCPLCLHMHRVNLGVLFSRQRASQQQQAFFQWKLFGRLCPLCCEPTTQPHMWLQVAIVYTKLLRICGTSPRWQMTSTLSDTIRERHLCLHPPSSTEYLFQLMAVLVHHGDMHSGHFVTYRRSPSSPRCSSPFISQWLWVSDDSVRKSTLQEVLSSNAYMLFYERVRRLKLALQTEEWPAAHHLIVCWPFPSHSAICASGGLWLWHIQTRGESPSSGGCLRDDIHSNMSELCDDVQRSYMILCAANQSRKILNAKIDMQDFSSACYIHFKHSDAIKYECNILFSAVLTVVCKSKLIRNS